MTWIIINHVYDLIRLSLEPPVQDFVRWVYLSPSVFLLSFSLALSFTSPPSLPSFSSCNSSLLLLSSLPSLLPPPLPSLPALSLTPLLPPQILLCLLFVFLSLPSLFSSSSFFSLPPPLPSSFPSFFLLFLLLLWLLFLLLLFLLLLLFILTFLLSLVLLQKRSLRQLLLRAHAYVWAYLLVCTCYKCISSVTTHLLILSKQHLYASYSSNHPLLFLPPLPSASVPPLCQDTSSHNLCMRQMCACGSCHWN